MNRAIEANNIHPIVDEKVFELAQLKDAYEYMVRCFRKTTEVRELTDTQWDQKHFGKLTIKVA
jgi:hypothetical protein